MQQNFKPAWWLPGPHLQTLWASLLRRKHKLDIKSERLELADGDFLDLAWVGSGTGPLVLILHGLNGCVNSHYANALLHTIDKFNWRGVLMHFRGCSGVPNRLHRSYHSGETNDLTTVLAELRKREPNIPIYVVGYSLGANVLLKALGENKITNFITAAVAVSVPFELDKTADYMCHGFAKFYQQHLVKNLNNAIAEKFNLLSKPKHKTFWEFDDAFTAPLHGFKSASDYYQQSSSRQFLTNIQTPTLILHAADDPFTPSNAIPHMHELNSKVKLELTACGGHVGFVSGKIPGMAKYWLEQRIMRYFMNDV